MLQSMKKKGCPEYHKVCKITPVNKHLKKLVIDKLIFKHKCSSTHKETKITEAKESEQFLNKRKTKQAEKDDKEEVYVPEEENTYTYANMIKHYKTCDIGEVFYKCPKCHDPK